MKSLVISLTVISSIIFVFQSVSKASTFIQLIHPEPKMSYLEKEVREITFFSDGKTVATSGYVWDTIFIWDIVSGKMFRKINLPVSMYSPGNITISSDGKLLAFSAGLALEEEAGISIVIFELSTNQILQTFIFDTPVPPEYGWGINCIIFSPDNRKLILSHGYWIYVWDIQKQMLEKIKVEDEYETVGDRIAFLPDNIHIIFDLSSYVYKVMNIETGAIEHKGDGKFYQLADNPENFIALEFDQDTLGFQLNERNIITGELVKKVGSFKPKSRPFLIDPTLKYLLSNSNNEPLDKRPISLEKIDNKSVILNISALLPEDFVNLDTNFMEFSPDGNWLAIGMNGDAFLLNISDLTSRVPNALEYTSFGN